MVHALPAPEVLRCYFDDTLEPQVPAMHLRWGNHRLEKLWELPEGVTLLGPAPECFGVSVQRMERDVYHVRLVWDKSCFVWPSISRPQLVTSAITSVLRSLGTDLWEMLDQPVNTEACMPCRAA